MRTQTDTHIQYEKYKWILCGEFWSVCRRGTQNSALFYASETDSRGREKKTLILGREACLELTTAWTQECGL